MELRDDTEVELICPRCHYRMRRTAARLRRETAIICPNCGEKVVPGAGGSGREE
jgi:predicted RNA-binding Zn-ribbon protein involved in translation (DUF1610 family)